MNLFKKSLVLIIFFFIGDLAVSQTLKTGMVKYYGLDKKSEILCVGHSHTVLGIDTAQLEKQLSVKVSRYAIAGANTLDRLWMIKHYLSINPDVEIVIYGVDPRLFDSEGLSSASYTLFLPLMDNRMISQYLQQEASWEEYFTCKFIRTARFRDQTLNISLRGIFNKNETKKTTVVQAERFQTYLAKEQKRKVRINTESVECFYDTLEYLSSLNKKVLLVNIPVIDLLNEIDRPNQKKALEIFEHAARVNGNVYLFDYNKEYESNHNLFFDFRHMNEKGKQIVTKRLVEDIERVRKENKSADYADLRRLLKASN
jgi:hypothetical protein